MRYRSLVPGLVLGVLVFALPAGRAKAQTQYTWQGAAGANWLQAGNWFAFGNPGTYAGTTNSPNTVANGASNDLVVIGASSGTIGIDFSNGTGNGSSGPASAWGRLTVGTITDNSGTGIVIANNAGGTTAGQNNGILQLTASTIMTNFSANQSLTFNRNTNGANAANADMAIRIGGPSTISLGNNSTIAINTQLVMDDATNRRITVSGAGALVLGADNTQAYTAAYSQGTYVGLQGGFTVNGGATLRIGADNNLGVATALANYLTLDGGTLNTTANLTIDPLRGITLTGNTGTINVNGGTTLTYNGVLAGGGGILTKTGTGILQLGGANTYTGATNVNTGTLQLTATNALAAATAVTVATGATLDTTNLNQTIGGLSGAGGVTLGTGVLTVNTNATPAAYSGVIAGTGGSFAKGGTGTVTLSGANTYDGGTTINAGTLRIGNAGATGSVVGAITDNGNLEISRSDNISFGNNISGTGTLTKTAGGITTLTGTNTYQGATNILAGTLAIDGDARLGTAPGAAMAKQLVINGGTLNTTADVTLNANRGIALGPTSGTGTGTINVATGTTLTYGGVMIGNGGTGNFAKAGAGTLSLSAAHTYTGSTTVSDGLLQMTGTGANQLPGGTALIIGGTGNPILDLNSNNQSIGTLSGGAAGIGQILIGNSTLTVNETADTSYAGIIAGTGGSLVKNGGSNLTLTGINTFDGPITIGAGTLTIGGAGTIPGTAGIANNGTLAIATSADQTISGNITGTGALTKTGAGTLTLSGTNGYTGATAINGGIAVAGSTSAFGSNSATSVGAGGTLRLNGFSQTLGSLAGSGTVENANATAAGVTFGGLNTNTTFSGLIQDGTGGGALALTKTGNGTFTLTGTQTYTGGTTVSGGVLQLGDGTTSGLVAGNITNNANVTFNPAATNNTYGGAISGSGSLTKIGANTQILSGASTYAGTTTINGGVLQLSGGADRLPTGTSVTLANTAGVALDLNGNNQTIAGLSGGGATGGNVSLGANTLTVNQTGSATYAGAISGTGGVLTMGGAGTLILNGANSFTGGLNINAGTVQVGTGGTTGTLAAAVPITNNGTLFINKSNDLTLNGAITGTGTVIKDGTGTLILGGTNTYTSGTEIRAGRVRIGAPGALPDSVNSHVIIAAGATLSSAPTAGGAGITETAGILRLTGNSTSVSTLELGTGSHILTFGGLEFNQGGGGNLTILGWTGPQYESGTQGRLLFNNLGADPNTTYATWLSTVQFGSNPIGGFFLDVGGGTFELTPVPEPTTVMGIAAAGLASLGLIRRRFRRGTEATIAA